jgi:hypothetical protein
MNCSQPSSQMGSGVSMVIEPHSGLNGHAGRIPIWLKCEAKRKMIQLYCYIRRSRINRVSNIASIQYACRFEA